MSLLAFPSDQSFNIAKSTSPVGVYLSRLAQGSRPTMRSGLEQVVAIVNEWTNQNYDLLSFPWGELRYQHTQAIRSQLASRYAHSTANKILSALRGVIKEAWRLGLISIEDYQRAVDLQPIKGSRPLKGRALQQEEIASLLRVCSEDLSPHGVRDAAILALLRSCGLRRSEVVNLELKDVNLSDRSLTVRAAKGNKTRIVPLSSHLIPRLEYWLQLRREAGLTDGAVFVRIRGSKITASGLSDQSVGDMLEKRCKEAGITVETTSHDLRRTFATHLFDAGVDPETVQKLMGHSQIQTSISYSRRDDSIKKAAVENLDL